MNFSSKGSQRPRPRTSNALPERKALSCTWVIPIVCFLVLFAPLSKCHSASSAPDPIHVDSGIVKVTTSPTIVWVVVGEWEKQKHVVESIRQARRWNDDASLVVLASESIRLNHSSDLLFDSTVEIRATEDLESDPTILEFNSNFFVSGVMGNADFNRHTSARLYYVNAWMKQSSVSSCFHLENDNMIYFNVAHWMEDTKSCGASIAITCREMKPKRKFMVAGVVFIRSWKHMDTILCALTSFLAQGREILTAQIGNEWVNDMSLLGEYYWSQMEGGHPPDLYTPPKALTILPEGASGLGADDPVGIDDTIRKCLWDRSKMIFDNAALAIWFYGDFFDRTPKANDAAWGAYERIPAKQHDLTWTQHTKMNLSYPLWGGVRVASLHMHSKQLEKVASRKCKTGIC